MNGVLVASFLLTAALFSRGADGRRLADLVLLVNAPADYRAMCLDGSPPGYYFASGSGSGANKWIVHLEGGGWCYNEDECVGRSRSRLGSSKGWSHTYELPSGILSDSSEDNPDFYNWNVAFVNYCDGASFVGDTYEPVRHNGTELYFRGLPILRAVIYSLLKDKGMDSAEEVILTGGSAGGLATYLLADYVASLEGFKPAKYRALADAGFFLDAPNYNGSYNTRNNVEYVFQMQNASGAGGLDKQCLDFYAPKNESAKCMVSPFAEPYVSTPLFALNSIYDSWQLKNILELPCTPPSCSSKYMEDFLAYGKEFLNAAAGLMSRDGRGYFYDACITHVQAHSSAWTTTRVNNQTAAETFANWYFGRTTGSDHEVDCAYPCNKSC